MLLGDLIARFDDEALAAETLFSLGDLALTSRVVSLAAEQNLSPGELASDAVGAFISRASDEDWLTLVGQMARAENPGAVFLRRALAAAL
jgi:hypothetical protein